MEIIEALQLDFDLAERAGLLDPETLGKVEERGDCSGPGEVADPSSRRTAVEDAIPSRNAVLQSATSVAFEPKTADSFGAVSVL